jgi:zona occludens toxin (predicted ATPase)
MYTVKHQMVLCVLKVIFQSCISSWYIPIEFFNVYYLSLFISVIYLDLYFLLIFSCGTLYSLFYVTYTNPNLLATNSATSPAVTATTEFPKTAFANSVPSESSLSCLYTTKVALSITHSSTDNCIALRRVSDAGNNSYFVQLYLPWNARKSPMTRMHWKVWTLLFQTEFFPPSGFYNLRNAIESERK